MTNKIDGRNRKAREELKNASIPIILQCGTMHCGLCNKAIYKDWVALKVRDENNKPWFFHTACPV